MVYSAYHLMPFGALARRPCTSSRVTGPGASRTHTQRHRPRASRRRPDHTYTPARQDTHERTDV